MWYILIRYNICRYINIHTHIFNLVFKNIEIDAHRTLLRLNLPTSQKGK